MSFDSTKNTIKLFEASGSASLDSLLGMLVCVLNDASELNGGTDLQKAEVKDNVELCRAAISLFSYLRPIVETCLSESPDGLDELPQLLQKKYQKGRDAFQKASAELASVEKEIEQIDSLSTQLEKTHSELKRKNEHLVEASEKCKKLQEEIETLSDTNLESAALKKDALEAELIERRKKNEAIVAQRETVEAELASCISEFNALKNAVAKMKKDIEALTEQDKIVRGESHQFEEEIATLQKKLAEYKEWMSHFPAQKKDLEEKLSEEKAKHISLINAWTSTRSDDDVKEILFKLPGSTDAFTIENYPDLAVAGTDMKDITMLEAWFEQIQKRVDGLLKLQETMVRTVVQQVEQITADN